MRAVLTFISAQDHQPSQQMARVVRDVVMENQRAGISLQVIDVDTEAERARELGVMSCPAIMLDSDGHQRGELRGVQSKRALLQLVLPVLYEPNEALIQLRSQLDSPGEQFPKRVLKRRERVNKAARVAMLGQVPLFRGLTKRQLRAIGEVADEVAVDAGAPITVEGTDGDQFFVVASGGLEVRRGTRLVAICGPGECVGEMSLLDGGPRSATVSATERSVLLTLDRMTFRSVLYDAPDVALRLLEVLSSRLRDL